MVVPRPHPMPELKQVLDWYHPASDTDLTDPEVPLEMALHDPRVTPAVVGIALEQLDGILADHDAGRRRVDEALPFYVGLPAGASWREFMGFLRGRLADHQPHVPLPEPQLAVSGLRLPRASSFPDEQTANEATTAVLRAHRRELEAWARRDDGRPRLQLYADLGHPVGRVVQAPPVARTVEELQAAQAAQAGGARGVDVSACVVMLRRNAGSPAFHVATAYPELTLDPLPRERYPDLTMVFGGFFGQDWPGLDHSTWYAETALNVGASAEVLQRVAGQLQQLLARDDAALTAAVEALGSYVLPDLMRRWVEGLHRRMTTLRWTPVGA